MKVKENRAIANWIIPFLLTLIGGLAIYGGYFASGNRDLTLIPGAEPAALDAPNSEEANQQDLSIYNDGVLVQQVDLNGPAAQAGIRRGSIILALNGEAVDSVEDLFQAIDPFAGGETISLMILNGDVPEEVAVILADERPLLGINIGDGCNCRTQPFDGDEIFPQFDHEDIPEGSNLPELPQIGVVIIGVEPNSPAANAGLLEGDIISAVNGDEINTFDQLAQQVRQRDVGDQLPLTVQRGDETLELRPILSARSDDDNTPVLGVQIGMFRFNSEPETGSE